MPEIKIDKKKINNQSYKVYIIAEAGLGHFSSLKEDDAENVIPG